MIVADILASKGHDVVTARPDSTLAHIANTLVERGIGAIIVTDAARKVLGIISERDIVRAIAKGGAAALGDVVHSHMTAHVTLAFPAMTVTQAMELMTHGRFRHLPVVVDGTLAGLVSIGDIVKHRLAEIEGESRAMRDYIGSA